MPLPEISTKLFADGANLDHILTLAADPRIAGFTTNPTLMKAAGIRDYEAFAHEVLGYITDRPISFEVFADEESEIRRQALRIADWADNVYVKVPITTTTGVPLTPLVRELSEAGVKVNVTAMFTLDQVREVTAAVREGAPSYQSIFAGRIADAGIDPCPLMAEAIEIMAGAPQSECIWASPREVLNLIQANTVGCHIITMTPDLLKKIDIIGRDLSQYSLETVQMFYSDASSAGYQL